MASVMKKFKKKVMKPIKRLKKIFNRWKSKRISTINYSGSSSSSSSSSWDSVGTISATSVSGINVGPERLHMNIPDRYLALPVFEALIEQGNQMFGYSPPPAFMTLPCESILVSNIVTLLDRDEERFRDYTLDAFIEYCFESPNWPNV